MIFQETNVHQTKGRRSLQQQVVVQLSQLGKPYTAQKAIKWPCHDNIQNNSNETTSGLKTKTYTENNIDLTSRDIYQMHIDSVSRLLFSMKELKYIVNWSAIPSISPHRRQTANTTGVQFKQSITLQYEEVKIDCQL